MAMNPDSVQSLPSRPLILRNAVCPFCGAQLDDANRTKEHVIGRKFVPKGKLNNDWNLIVQACRPCNNTKSQLEDDISAITMQPDAWGKFPVDDAVLVAEAQRKAQHSGSRATGKAVKDSAPELSFDTVSMPGVSMGFSFTAPPQVADDRAFELARLQLMPFFFYITYDEQKRRGWWWPGEFMPYLHSRRSDWGSASWRGFMTATQDWDMRIDGRAADQFFCVSIKRHPTAECWSWALQWNHQHRLCGFLGDRAAAQVIVDAIPVDSMHHISTGPNSHIRVRRDTPLELKEDGLFPSD